ncbi:hypothetical protein BDR26DRAFT_573943 [Obelidium mucronatum]|nr:hypothetical protein BDR26DRAFT_573943 [Obelidium mucronatum]
MALSRLLPCEWDMCSPFWEIRKQQKFIGHEPTLSHNSAPSLAKSNAFTYRPLAPIPHPTSTFNKLPFMNNQHGLLKCVMSLFLNAHVFFCHHSTFLQGSFCSSHGSCAFRFRFPAQKYYHVKYIYSFPQGCHYFNNCWLTVIAVFSPSVEKCGKEGDSVLVYLNGVKYSLVTIGKVKSDWKPLDRARDGDRISTWCFKARMQKMRKTFRRKRNFNILDRRCLFGGIRLKLQKKQTLIITFQKDGKLFAASR